MKNDMKYICFKSKYGIFEFDPITMQIFNDNNEPIILRRKAQKNNNNNGRATINVIKGCNLGCGYCKHNKKIIEKMPYKTGEDIIDFIFSIFSERLDKIRISFTSNGEPTLNLKTIKHIIDYANMKNNGKRKVISFSFNFASNSTILTHKQLNEIINEHGVDIYFSIDGYKSLHDEIRKNNYNKNSNYEMVYENIKYLKENLSKIGNTITCSTVFTSINSNFDEVIKHLDEIGIDNIVTRPVRGDYSIKYGLNKKTVNIFLRGYKKILKIIEREILSGNTELFKKICNRYDYIGRLFVSLISGEVKRQGCPGCPSNYDDICKYSLVFDVNGDVYYPCRDFIGYNEYKIGNIYSGVDLDLMRNNMEKLCVDNRMICRNCWARKMCGGGCYNSTFLSTGQVQIPDKNICNLIISLAKRIIEITYVTAMRRPDVFNALQDYIYLKG
jgi:uncharacterized protein